MVQNQKLSVIIPAYWQTDLTVVHVRECMNSSRIPDEIVVCNDTGDLKLRDKLFNLPRKTKIIYAYILPPDLFQYNGACNLGVWLSTGDIIAIEDADHIPDRDTYKKGLEILVNKPEINRVAYNRYWVELEDVLKNPFENWKKTGSIGCNQMVSLIRRDLYIKMGGQDERMVEYGWLAYDFVMKYKKLKAKTEKSGYYYIVRDGSEQNIKRGMSEKNRKIYKENCQREHIKHPYGILNFQYDVEFWDKNL